MALQVAHTLPTGIEMPNAYTIIDSITLNDQMKRAEVSVKVFLDKSVADAGWEPVIKFQMIVNNRTYKNDKDEEVEENDYDYNFWSKHFWSNGKDPISQAYALLKTRTYEGIDFELAREV